MLGQVGHFFKFSKEDVPYAKERYLTEAKRLLTVLDKALEGGRELLSFVCLPLWWLGLPSFDTRATIVFRLRS